MTRRIVRTGVQLVVLLTAAFFVVFFVDNRYRVLPQAVHSHLPLHHEGLVITDITVQTCSTLNPLSKCMLDQKKWHRVEKDLYLGAGWVSKAYVHIKRKREEELTSEDKVIVDVRTGKLDPAVGEKAQASEKWESRPAGVWIKRSLKRHASNSKRAVTAVDILFGSDAVEPRPGWELVKNGALHLDTARDSKDPRLSIRRGAPQKTEKPVPKIRKDGKFKIMQISDLHLSTGLGACRDPEPKGANGGHCDADPRTLEFVERLLDEEKPDMVVLSGDQVNGDTAPDVQSAMFKIIEPLAERKIPYAAIFGNHDDEGSLALSRHAQMSLYESLPYSLSEAGPNTIDGVGNYYVEIQAHSSKHSALTLYFLDTHSYSPDETHYRGYDWIKPNQINWFQTTADGLKDAHSHYTHQHLNMAFIHIPLPEYANRDNEWVGNWTEGVTAPGFNTHFKDALVQQGVKAVSCGHDHVNDYCMLSTKDETTEPELWMCYAGGSGFGGYGGYNHYHRRLRVFEIDTNQARISTWKRLEHGDTAARLDEQIIVDSGQVKGIEIS
ncbi:Metallo-dependent phosphatase [Dothidotthia symphoricarpi CBS 119687]|uniref:Metallo-dependent phosphatase n=1 Tax=Dothidotthia symphoricarpi CBS 119687 TaxID=1392245 RepID=A0A6A6ALW3_9PLEO|nr:Metallo-dependent phosphatase [Dothidotthia symphoricarpi CBS 119687]KAF2132118.1 Metallo-dependent phosphatase [Dothidotthia symphoricarpi CBS 119687]